MDDLSWTWQLLGQGSKWITLLVTLECFTIATLFFMCGFRAAKFSAYSQVRSFTMTVLGFWFLTDGIVKTVRFIDIKAPVFNTESIYIIFARFGTGLVGIAAIYGLIHLYRGIKKT